LNSSFIRSQESATVNLNGWAGCGPPGTWKEQEDAFFVRNTYSNKNQVSKRKRKNSEEQKQII
jgi:hypothetical protein